MLAILFVPLWFVRLFAPLWFCLSVVPVWFSLVLLGLGLMDWPWGFRKAPPRITKVAWVTFWFPGSLWKIPWGALSSSCSIVFLNLSAH